MDSVGIKLKRLRSSNNLTQAQLAENIGVSIATIVNVEVGLRTVSTKLAIKLSEYFHTSFDYWIEKYSSVGNGSSVFPMDCFTEDRVSSPLDLNYTRMVLDDLLNSGYFNSIREPLNKSLNELFNDRIRELLITAIQYDVLKRIISERSK